MPTILPRSILSRYFSELCYTPIQKPLRSYLHIIHLWAYKIFTLADNFKRCMHSYGAKHGGTIIVPSSCLIIFHDSSYRSSTASPDLFSCMNKFRLIPLMPAEADIRACLKIKTVRARGNFSILLLPWHPHFDTVFAEEKPISPSAET